MKDIMWYRDMIRRDSPTGNISQVYSHNMFLLKIFHIRMIILCIDWVRVHWQADHRLSNSTFSLALVRFDESANDTSADMFAIKYLGWEYIKINKNALWCVQAWLWWAGETRCPGERYSKHKTIREPMKQNKIHYHHYAYLLSVLWLN